MIFMASAEQIWPLLFLFFFCFALCTNLFFFMRQAYKHVCNIWQKNEKSLARLHFTLKHSYQIFYLYNNATLSAKNMFKPIILRYL